MTDPSIVVDLIDAFRRSKCMFTAASMGVFEKTPLTLAEMAADHVSPAPPTAHAAVLVRNERSVTYDTLIFARAASSCLMTASGSGAYPRPAANF